MIPANNFIFAVSFVKTLLITSNSLILFSVSYITILKIPTENLIFAMFHVTILSFIPKIRFRIPYNNVIFALSYISILRFLPKSSAVSYVMSVDLT